MGQFNLGECATTAANPRLGPQPGGVYGECETVPRLGPQPGGVYDWVVRCVQAMPGATPRELGVAFSPTDPGRIGKRLGYLERQAKIFRGNLRMCKSTGFLSDTWWPNPLDSGQ